MISTALSTLESRSSYLLIRYSSISCRGSNFVSGKIIFMNRTTEFLDMCCFWIMFLLRSKRFVVNLFECNTEMFPKSYVFYCKWSGQPKCLLSLPQMRLHTITEGLQIINLSHLGAHGVGGLLRLRMLSPGLQPAHIYFFFTCSLSTACMKMCLLMCAACWGVTFAVAVASFAVPSSPSNRCQNWHSGHATPGDNTVSTETVGALVGEQSLAQADV